MATAKINPEVLKWASSRDANLRERLVDDYPNFEKWLSGEKQPTVNQLFEISRKTKVPFSIFFLKELPSTELPIKDFRRLANTYKNNPSPELFELIQQSLDRQQWLSSFLELEGYAQNELVNIANTNDSVVNTAKLVREILGLSEDWTRQVGDKTKAFNYLREALEEIGVNVSVASILGLNTRAKFDIEEFRGFALVDKYAPFIFINGNDSRHAQLFTLAHELGHIVVGESAIENHIGKPDTNEKIELFCNKLASEILIPEIAFIRSWEATKGSASIFKDLSSIFKVSTVVIAKRALDLGFITRSVFFDEYNNALAIFKQSRDKLKESDNGPNPITLVPSRIGRVFLNHVLEATRGRKLYQYDASKLVGVKRGHLHMLSSL